MKNLVIYGAGGFGREMLLMVNQINAHQPTWKMIGFFDDGKKKNDLVEGLVVLGGRSELNAVREPLSVCIAIADPVTRNHIVSELSNPNLSFPSLFHPGCLKGSDLNSFKDGCIITAGVILTTTIQFGKFCIVNLGSTIGHDVKLGEFCTVMPGCSISGNVQIGARTVMGTGSRILQGLTIGEDCMIGAGAVVTKDFGSHLKLLGVPARKRNMHVE
jgi:sugar O-acyltransferase (sialic acid O-acetyltransferase NeuD family)